MPNKSEDELDIIGKELQALTINPLDPVPSKDNFENTLPATVIPQIQDIQDKDKSPLKPRTLYFEKNSEEKTRKELKLLVHYDDSSDEEYVENSREKSTIAERYLDFLENGKRNFPYFEDTTIDYVFILHYAGIYLFYSDVVNQRYYPLKSKQLAHQEIPEEFIQYIKNAITDTIKQLIPIKLSLFYVKISSKPPKKTILIDEKELETIAEEILEKLDTSIDKKIQDISGHRSWLTAKSYEQLDHDIQLVLKELQEAIQHALSTSIETHKLIIRGKVSVDSFNHANHSSARVAINLDAQLYAINELWNKQWFRHDDNEDFRLEQLKTPEKISEGRKKVYSKINIASTCYPKLVEHCLNDLANLNQGGSVSNKLKKDTKYQYAYHFLRDLEASDNANPDKSPQTPAWQYAKKHPEIKKFLKKSPERFVDDCENFFQEKLIENLNVASKKYISRKTLGSSLTFFQDNSVNFFANLRLSNRGQKRELGNIRNNSLLQQLYTGSQRKITHRQWQFSRHPDAIESQGIIVSSLGRQDEIDNASSYKNISLRLESLKSFIEKEYGIEIKDAAIANWLREIIQDKALTQIDDDQSAFSPKDKKTIKQFLVDISYLLFGTEVVRNPASIITHQMVLDLIIQERWTWSNALKECGMPMAADNAVASARFIQNILNPYMPYPYIYPGTPGGTQQERKAMFEGEASVLSSWLACAENYNEEKITELTADISEFYKLILQQCEKWYGFNCLESDREKIAVDHNIQFRTG